MFRSGGGLSTTQAAQAVRPVSQSATPTTGQTVSVVNAETDVILWITPAGALAALTVTLPSGYIGQRVHIGSSQAITALTINGASTIYNAINTLSIGDSFEMIKVSSNTWARPA